MCRHRPNAIASVLTLGLLCLAFDSVAAEGAASIATEDDRSAAHRPHVRVPVFPGEYGVSAVANLSIFRSELLSKNAVLFSPKHNVTEDSVMKHSRYQMYQPHITCPPGRPLERVGSNGDGGKFVCALKALRPPCIIYSLGSNMQFDFEEAVLAQTECHVHTFDCTVEGRVLDPARHSFHKICIGDPSMSAVNRTFETFSSITRRLGHHKITLLKMDIESYEFRALGELREYSQGLPEQISVELHFYYPEAGYLPEAARRQEQMSLVFFHLANLGYGIVSYEPNPWGDTGCCAEYTFLRVEHDVLSHVRQRKLLWG